MTEKSKGKAKGKDGFKDKGNESKIKKGIFFIIFFVVIAEVTFSAQSQKTFILGSLSAEPGKMVSSWLEVPAGQDPATQIPVTVINGIKPGKVLAVISGIHPYEYPPILASYRLKKMINPKELSGTLILVHIAHLSSFQRRTIYYNPYDWKNLNRVFPGDLKGTQSQRIAAIITEEIINRAEAVIDMHCGDGNEALIPYTYWMTCGDEKIDEVSKQMALAFGIRHIIIDSTRPRDLKNSRYLSWTAILRGKPSITTEYGYLGRVDEEMIQANVYGVLNVMKYFGMLPGKAQLLSEPVWIDKYEVIYSKHDGLFYPVAKMGYYVQVGQIVGYIEDYFGNLLEEVGAPFTGILLYIINTPPCNTGEPLFEVGRVKESSK
ncbi:MAG: M14 family metallopeptidase [Candidatus Aminicenantes bacterium]|nr:M14 family metallopeptidase [Candidatus Aminicenantes bacterium]